MKQIKAMVLAEIMIALFICTILMGVSVYMFKATEVKISPYVYSVLDALPKANRMVINQCYQEGTCSVQNLLPDNMGEYCTRLSEQLGTVGDVYCSTSGDANSSITLNRVTYGRNLILTNGVSLYNLNPSSGWNASDYAPYIDIIMQIGTSTKLGEGLFVLRVLKYGEVIPGRSITSDGITYSALDDELFFPYRIMLNKAYDNQSSYIRTRVVVDAKEVLNSYEDEGGNSASYYDSSELPFRDKMSFREAICATDDKLFSLYYAGQEECGSIKMLEVCSARSGNGAASEDLSAYCYAAPYKPRGAGIFKVLGL